jgi:hypothetical protein
MEVMVYGDVQFANIRYRPYPLISQAIVEQYKRIWGDTQFKDQTDCFLTHAGFRGDGISLAWALESRAFGPRTIVLEKTTPESGMSHMCLCWRGYSLVRPLLARRVSLAGKDHPRNPI